MTNRELVGIQGVAGANHEIAARQLYGDSVTIEYIRTFDELFMQLRDKSIGRAVVAFSNTTTDTGFIPTPWKEMKTKGSDYWLTDKTEVLVRHHLLSLPSATLDSITSVHSMGVALEQCEETLHGLLPNIQLVHEDDTALSAQLVRELGDPTRAAVATELAGEINGLKVLAADIQDDNQNRTGFYGWSLRAEGLEMMTGNENKTLMFVNPPHVDTAGTLLSVLMAFKDQSINLADLHSISIPGSGTRGKQFLIEANTGFQSDKMQETLIALGDIGCKTLLLGSWIDTIETPLVLDESTV